MDQPAKIYVVEDESLVAADIRSILEKMGHDVVGTTSRGEDAISDLQNKKADLVLMDIRLKGELKGELNGIESAHQIRSGTDIPVIYLTAYADDATIARAKKTQPYGYILKPIKEEELKSVVEIALYKHRMEKKVTESQKWLVTTLTSIGDGVIASDENGRVKFMNPVAQELTGWPEAEAIGKPLETVFHIINELTREKCENPATKVIQTGQIVGLANHTLLVRRDGREIPIKDSGAPIVFRDNAVAGVVLVFQNDSATRKADLKLKASEELFRKAFEYANEGVCLVTPEGIIERANPRLCEMFGYTAQELEGKNVQEISHPDDRHVSPEVIRNFKEKHISQTVFGKRYVHKNGNTVWARVSSAAIRDENGHLDKYISHLQDVTAQKMANAALSAEKRRTEQYLQLAGVMFIGLDPQGRICLANQKATEVLGYTEEEIMGKSWFEHFLPESIRDDVQSVFRKIMQKSGEPFEFFENPVITKDGRERLIAWHNKVIRNDKGEIEIILASGEDKTAYKRLEEQFQQVQKMEAMGTLAGGIAHDFNNILASIIGFTELSFEQVEKGSSLEDNLQEIYTAGKRAKHLVRQILTFARHDKGEAKPMIFSRIAKEAMKFLRSTLPTSIEIRQHFDTQSLIMGDPTQIHQIIMNLCTNAAHAMEENGGRLEVKTRDIELDAAAARQLQGVHPGKYILFTVSDTGSGISPKHIHSIFEPYFTTKEPETGTGLGLSVVHGIVKKHQGEIVVESQLNKGSLFSVYLPITQKSQEIQPYRSTILPVGTERILFVDDEYAIAKMGSQILENLGYTVTTRTCGLEALETFRSRPHAFDLVISDMTMPNISGDQLVAKMMEIRPDIPVILCTGYSKRLSSKTVIDLNIQAIAYKPIVKSDLAQTVRKVLDGEN